MKRRKLQICLKGTNYYNNIYSNGFENKFLKNFDQFFNKVETNDSTPPQQINNPCSFDTQNNINLTNNYTNILTNNLEKEINKKIFKQPLPTVTNYLQQNEKFNMLQSQKKQKKYTPRKTNRRLKSFDEFENSTTQSNKDFNNEKKSLFITTKLNKNSNNLDFVNEINNKYQEAKKQSKLLKNRKSANKSREKKRNQVDYLEARVVALEQELNKFQKSSELQAKNTNLNKDNWQYALIFEGIKKMISLSAIGYQNIFK